MAKSLSYKVFNGYAMPMIAFIIISLIIITCSVFVVTSRNLIHSAVALFFSFLGVVGVYLLLSLEFLAFVQIFLFVGTVSILILFALMMIKDHDIKKSNIRGTYAKWGFFAAFVFFVFFEIFAVRYVQQISPKVSFQVETLTALGKTFLTQMIVPFEIISVVLLTALIGTITLIKHRNNAA